MGKKKTKLQIAQEQAETALSSTNKKIEELGSYTGDLYIALNSIQESFDRIRNVPSEKKIEYEKLKSIRLQWKQQVDKIDNDFKNAVVKNAGAGAAGIGAGVAVAALGPTAAMGIATTFGVASTGTAISTLSGAAATNAALAWLGGGALAAGGGGMAAGNAFLALAGPVGWAIAGVAIISSGLMFWKAKSDQKRLENIFTLISERDVTCYELAIVELNERISRIAEENSKLGIAIERIVTFGLDYTQMTDDQQYELGAYVNLMAASTQLLVNPILGLQPKYTENDCLDYFAHTPIDLKQDIHMNKDLQIYLCNLLYKIELDKTDMKLLWKSFKKNKEFLSSMELKKKEFDFVVIETAMDMLEYKYQSQNAAN